ncbi:MAG: ribosomal RNA small subunit methyltransferase I [Leptothrix sp. (in: Bacteria)]|nr:ribosomal RNA small subunit methyltransferase I [Leptothrix sp. (in: b-proteobacteria)]
MSATATTPGTLLLVPNTLDLGAAEVDLRQVLPDGVIRRAAGLRHWAAEDARSTRAFLKRVGAITPLAAPLQAIGITELPRPRKGSREAVPAAEWQALLQPALAGHDLGLLSEAGLPAVADPGAALVHAAHEAGVPVLPLPGASSLLLALAASGLNGQSFAFVGYLPQDAVPRAARLKELEALSRRLGQTQLIIETPYRNAALLAAMVGTLGPTTRIAVSCGLTLPGGWSRCDNVAGWRKRPADMPDRWPAVFSLLAA